MKQFEIEALTLRRGDRFTLQIDSLELETAEKIAIVGQNGSGKTTLLRVLAMLEPPDKCASFRFRGGKAGDSRISRDGLGFLRQQPYMFSGTVAQNVAYPLRLRRVGRAETARRVHAQLEQVGLTHLAASSARRLSGGEQKRLALARVLVAEPTLLLLDEPTAHLDRSSGRVIEEVLRTTGATLLLTTHDLHLAHRLCTRVLTLQNGRISPSLPENVLSGRTTDGHIETAAGLKIALPPAFGGSGDTVSVLIDPRNMVLSKELLPSSMRNHFRGRVTSVREEGHNVWVEVDCGERLTAIISKASYQELDINLHRDVVVSFKANAVEVL